jgi:hypothetical protein
MYAPLRELGVVGLASMLVVGVGSSVCTIMQ